MMKNNKGIALLTVLLVTVVGLILTGIITSLIIKGYQNYHTAKDYQIAFQIAQSGLEEAIWDIEHKSYQELSQYLTSSNSQSGATYEIYQVFWKPLSGFGGAPSFPPKSSAYSGISGLGIFYLIHSQATQGNSQADLYVLYVKG